MLPASRASSHRTILFALAACVSFGFAIRDTLDARSMPVSAGTAIGLDAGDLPAVDGVPSAAELAEADEAFARAAAERAADPAEIERALRMLLEPGVAPASWLGLDDASTAARLAVLERLDIRVDPSGPIVRVGASVPCADLAHAAAAMWGAPDAHQTWTGAGYRAAVVFRTGADGACELRMERTP